MLKKVKIRANWSRSKCFLSSLSSHSHAEEKKHTEFRLINFLLHLTDDVWRKDDQNYLADIIFSNVLDVDQREITDARGVNQNLPRFSFGFKKPFL